MITIRDTIAGQPITFYYVQSKVDCDRALEFAKTQKAMALDTESTGINCYTPEWALRTFQFGHHSTSFVIPARWKKTIYNVLKLPVIWMGHNGPHDIRSLDVHLGIETGIVCEEETYLPSHHLDPRNIDEGGSGHGLKELAISLVDRNAGKWEVALKKEFKKIRVKLPGEYYKSGVRKGEPKDRPAHYAEGWALISPTNLIYIAYAASDPILTYRLCYKLSKLIKQSNIDKHEELYTMDHAIQMACDLLQRRGMKLDVDYTQRFSLALDSKAKKMAAKAAELGCGNIYSTVQVVNALTNLGAKLTERTPKGRLKADDRVLRRQLEVGSQETQELVEAILLAKQLSKRREAYADSMLREMDAWGRIHPSINSLAARTARMSVSKPPLQQLPTKNAEE